MLFLLPRGRQSVDVIWSSKGGELSCRHGQQGWRSVQCWGFSSNWYRWSWNHGKVRAYIFLFIVWCAPHSTHNSNDNANIERACDSMLLKFPLFYPVEICWSVCYYCLLLFISPPCRQTILNSPSPNWCVRAFIGVYSLQLTFEQRK